MSTKSKRRSTDKTTKTAAAPKDLHFIEEVELSPDEVGIPFTKQKTRNLQKNKQ